VRRSSRPFVRFFCGYGTAQWSLEEPLYYLPALRMHVRHGGIGPLFIDFAVCEDHPLVFIKGATLLAK
jgi:hypothetical protein